MDPQVNDPDDLLTDAREKARRLLDQLLHDQARLLANPPSIPPEDLEQGKTALANAVAAARRTVAALDAAAAIQQGN